jgi:hypothetical protein
MEKGPNVGRGLAVLAENEAADRAKAGEGCGDSSRAAIVALNIRVGIEVSRFAFVLDVDSFGALVDGAATVSAGSPSEVGAAARVDRLNVEEGGGSGGACRCGRVVGGPGHCDAEAPIGDDALDADRAAIPARAGGSGRLLRSGRGQQVVEQVARFGGSRDAGTEHVAENTGSDGVMAVGVGSSTENSAAEFMPVRVTHGGDAGVASGRYDEAGKRADGRALSTEVGGEDFSKLEWREGIPPRWPRGNPLGGKGVGGQPGLADGGSDACGGERANVTVEDVTCVELLLPGEGALETLAVGAIGSRLINVSVERPWVRRGGDRGLFGAPRLNESEGGGRVMVAAVGGGGADEGCEAAATSVESVRAEEGLESAVCPRRDGTVREGTI